MKLFENYTNGLSDLINKDKIKTFSSFSDNKNITSYFEKGMINESLELLEINSKNKVLIEFDKTQLETLFGQNTYSFSENSIGSHPDFKSIEHHEYENHYCVSLFMDIKGSTRLIEKYSLLEIRKIKDTILTLAIHVSSHFGGHVHRLQGDGIFIQFVRKGQTEQNAVINALNAASVLTHFISSDLAGIFTNIDVKPLTVRTGIDLGFKEDVIWSHYGISGCSELTTTSLHTDLAAKLQAKSQPNGILVGGNIQEILDIKPLFCKDIKKENDTIDYYIYQGDKNYRKFNFDWKQYLYSFDFTKRINSGNGIEIDNPNIKINCTLSEENGLNSESYFQNSKAINKGTHIKFTLTENGHAYHRKGFDIIEWKAFNSGKDASDAGQEVHDFGGKCKNKTFCDTTAAYKGHHYVECTIKREHSPNKKYKFSIFIE